MQGYWNPPKNHGLAIPGKSNLQKQVQMPRIGDKMLVCIMPDYSFIVGDDYAPSDGAKLVEVEVKALKTARTVIE